MPIGTIWESRTCSTYTDRSGTTFGMQMIADRFGDGWHNFITDIFVEQRIEALVGNRWHK